MSPEPDATGGGFIKGSTGQGHRQARHIPWPEIFKHHISVVEGHLRLLEMVQKHTIPNSSHWRSISNAVNRAGEMLHVARQETKTFVESIGMREQGPVGSSSISMCPDYSLVDHRWENAAEEFGVKVAFAEAQGKEHKPSEDGPQYETGQAKRSARQTLAQMRVSKARPEKGNGAGAESRSKHTVKLGTAHTTKSNGASQAQSEPTSDLGNPYFVIDVNPTPVAIPRLAHRPFKRSSEDRNSPDMNEARKHKKAKKEHNDDLPMTVSNEQVEFEDISGEVDLRMKEKEEKRKRKEEKKRKREAEGSSGGVDADVSKIANETEAVEKRKKKKKTKVDDGADVSEIVSKRSLGEGEKESELDGKKKKKRKKNKDTQELGSQM